MARLLNVVFEIKLKFCAFLKYIFEFETKKLTHNLFISLLKILEVISLKCLIKLKNQSNPRIQISVYPRI